MRWSYRAFIPAGPAARIASPAAQSVAIALDDEPGRVQLDLPFTYKDRDICAVMPFLTGRFDARGEDSSGEFLASAPEVHVQWSGAGSSAPAFTVSATTWLRPYDLGVSQRVRISVKPSDDERICVASLGARMQSGDLASWRRTNTRFIGLLRQHLLSWRALPGRRKQELFELSMEMLGGNKNA